MESVIVDSPCKRIELYVKVITGQLYNFSLRGPRVDSQWWLIILAEESLTGYVYADGVVKYYSKDT
jgi:hypothetical protein